MQTEENQRKLKLNINTEYKNFNIAKGRVTRTDRESLPELDSAALRQ